MDIMKALGVIFRYKMYSEQENEEEFITAVDGVDLNIHKGDFVGILGHNGCGKSTLAKQLAGLLYPTEGYIYINGMDSRREEYNLDIRKTAGIVFQNPDNQLIGNVVEEDIAFGPENLGVPREEIWDRVAAALEATGMSAYRFHSPKALSGGQKQKIAISGILAMEPECLILDEPTAMLDPQGRKEVLEAIHRLNREKSITIILITHHVEEVQDADDIYVMKQGKVLAHSKPEEIWKQSEMLEDCGIGLPFAQKLGQCLKQGHDSDRLENNLRNAEDREIDPAGANRTNAKEKEIAQSRNMPSEICFDHVSFRYENHWEENSAYALQDLSFTISQGEYIAIIGKTGSGKSTLLQHLNGLLEPTEGRIYFNGRDMHLAGRESTALPLKEIRQKVALCFQYPEYQLFEESVLKDICFGPKNLGFNKEECIKKARQAMRMMGLSKELEDLSPFSLSGGQKRRVALAGILAMDPDILVLDEPVAGMDQKGKDQLFDILEKLNKENGVGIILVSHDMDDVAAHARRVIVMDQGKIILDEDVRTAFSRRSQFAQLGLELPHATSSYFKINDLGYGKNVGAQDRKLPLPMTVGELADYIRFVSVGYEDEELICRLCADRVEEKGTRSNCSDQCETSKVFLNRKKGGDAL